MPLKYQAVIFDMDGTLVDSERALLNTWDSTAREMGYVFSLDIMMSTIGLTLADTQRVMRGAYPDAPHGDIRTETSSRFKQLRESGKIALRQGALETLEEISRLGMKIGLCTSTRSSSARITLESTGIYKFFDAIVYGDDITRGKPDPEPYLLAASRLCVDPACCFAVEDSPSGALSALSAGMTVAVVPDILPVPENVAERTTVLKNIAQIAKLIC